MALRVPFTLERRFCTDHTDGESIEIHVDVSKPDWYSTLTRAMHCKKITTVGGKEIDKLDTQALFMRNCIAEGWGPGYARRITVPMMYEADYYHNFDVWFDQLESNIISSIVGNVVTLKPSKFRTMMTHENYDYMVATYGPVRSNLHKNVMTTINNTISEEYYDKNYKSNEYDIEYLKDNLDIIVHYMLGYIKACIICSMYEYKSGLNNLLQENATHLTIESFLVEFFTKVVQDALLEIWGTFEHRGYNWIHNNKCSIPDHVSGQYDPTKNQKVNENRFALFSGINITQIDLN